jgi:hypothetical protein
MAFGSLNETDKGAGQKSDRETLSSIAGRIDKRIEPGDKRMGQLSEESKIPTQIPSFPSILF